MAKKVGIILINYKDYAEHFLANCRDSLRGQDYPREDWRVFIIDNASTPDSAHFLQESFPEAKILPRSDGNYCAANNLGFKKAIESGCDYVVTVNMDTEAHPAWLSELVKALDNNPEAAIAQSKVYLYPKNEEDKKLPRLNTLGNMIHYLGYGLTSYYNEVDRQIEGYPEISGYASGCSFIMRPEIWVAIGGYNEEFYMYHDDIELSLKVHLLGKKIILAPESKIFHKYEFNRSIKMLYYLERNRWLTILSFYPVKFIVLLFPIILFMQFGSLIYSISHGYLGTLLKIWQYFLRPSSYIKIINNRRQLKRLTVVPFRNIAKEFQGRILFQEIANPVLIYFVNPILAAYWQLVKKII